MKTENHITASCIISRNAVYKNGERLFTNPGTDSNGFLVAVYKYLDPGYARFYKMDNLGKLGWLSSEILLKNSFPAGNYQPEQTGLVFWNANSSLDTDLKYQETIKDIPSPSVFVYTLPNIMIGEICIRNHFKGESAFFISEAFDAGFVQQYVSNLLNNGILAACICGWVEFLEKEYKAVLFLVEKREPAGAVLFNKENITKLFQAENK